jgi:NADH dehydrogenase
VSEQQELLVTVVGGSGFIGRHVVRALAGRGCRIRVAVRRPDLAGHLQPMGAVGQIVPVQVNVRYPASLAAACEGADAVVNLVAVLASSGAQTFEALHVFGAAAVARAAREAGARRLVHVSALGVDKQSPSAYARTKAEGEERVRAEFPSASILRPSVVFGPEDDFFNRFATLARFSPALPLIGGGHTRFQPVYVGDVAAAVRLLVDGLAPEGRTWELGGPEVVTLRRIMEMVLEMTGRRRLLVPLPWSIAMVQGALLQLLPKPLLTVDQVKLLKRDNVVSAAAEAEGRTLAGLGITPTGMAAIVPGYLYRYRKAGQFTPPAGGA